MVCAISLLGRLGHLALGYKIRIITFINDHIMTDKGADLTVTVIGSTIPSNLNHNHYYYNQGRPTDILSQISANI